MANRKFKPYGWLGAVLLLSACASGPALQPEALKEADQAIEQMIAAHQMPGGVYRVERLGGAPYQHAYGQRAVLPAPEVAEESTVYDAASLTKVVVTAPLIQILRERGLLDIEAPLQRYLPDCALPAPITLRQLLTHSSGLPPSLPLTDAWQGRDQALALACRQTLMAPPGSAFRYSDINYILLGAIIERVSGKPLQVVAREDWLLPLGMADSGYLPLQRLPRERIAPTEILAEGQVLRGEVHDPTSRRMGGVAGHAGLFTTTADLGRLARTLLRGGVADDGRRVLSAESVALLSTPQSPAGLAVRGLGFDIDSTFSRPRGTLYPKTSFGHTGFTGCVLWMDPSSQSYFVLLANRVHPGPPGNSLPLYGQLGTASARAVQPSR